MKSSCRFLLLFLLVIAGDFNSIHILSNSQPSALKAPLPKCPRSKPSAMKDFSDQGPALLVLQDGTIHFLDGKSEEQMWSFSLGSSLSSIYQAFPDDVCHQHAKSIPYPYGNVIDFGDSFFRAEDSNELDHMKVVRENVGRAPIISNDLIGKGQTITKVLDAENGSMIENSDFVRLMDVYVFSSFDQVSQHMLWNITISQIRAVLHLQENVEPLPGSHLHFVLDKLNNIERELFDIVNSDVHLNSTFLAPIEDAKNLPSSKIVAIGGSGLNSSFFAPFQMKNIWAAYENFDLRNTANLSIVCCSIILLLYGSSCIVKRQQSTKQLNELRGQKSIVSKMKKARKVKRSGNGVNHDKENDIMSREEREDHKGSNSVKDGRMVGTLFVSNVEIGKGSNGTVVFEGMSYGRQVAVKRLVRAHHDVAEKEIQNLILSDQHPNIVQLYGVERDADFVYLSLERCLCSLYDLIQISSDSSRPSVKNIPKDVELWKANGFPSSELLKIMREIVLGIAHLHDLGIIHRDLKPQNILITKEKSLCAKIADMGISKRLVGDNASLGDHPTGYGSMGWQAPEQLCNGRQTRAVDVFSIGCILFFCITGGNHPFGECHSERDREIKAHRRKLSEVDHIPEASDLLAKLLEPKPEARPSTWNIITHPFFWSSQTRLSFFRDASDRVELEDRKTNSAIWIALENTAMKAFGGKWDTKMDPAFITNIGTHRRYKFGSVRDLL